MLTWRVFGHGLPDLRIRARSFDAALAEARLHNQGYVGCQVVPGVPGEF